MKWDLEESELAVRSFVFRPIKDELLEALRNIMSQEGDVNT